MGEEEEDERVLHFALEWAEEAERKFSQAVNHIATFLEEWIAEKYPASQGPLWFLSNRKYDRRPLRVMVTERTKIGSVTRNFFLKLPRK